MRPLLESEVVRSEVPQWVTTPHTIRQVESLREQDRNRRLAQYAFGVCVVGWVLVCACLSLYVSVCVCVRFCR